MAQEAAIASSMVSIKFMTLPISPKLTDGPVTFDDIAVD